jgi:YgiT-type zinc finger domain-containing protein
MCQKGMVTMNKKRICPVCGSDKIIKSIGTEIFEYKGKKIPVKNYTLYKCERCGESIADPESRKRGIDLIHKSIGSF